MLPRFVRTVRQDCLDYILVVSQRHLAAVLAEYVCHYNEARPSHGFVDTLRDVA